MSFEIVSTYINIKLKLIKNLKNKAIHFFKQSKYLPIHTVKNICYT